MKELLAAQVLLLGALASPQYNPAGYQGYVPATGSQPYYPQQQQQPQYAPQQPQYAPQQQPQYAPQQPQYMPQQPQAPYYAPAPAPAPVAGAPGAAPVVPSPTYGPAPYFPPPPVQRGPVSGPRMGAQRWVPKIGQKVQVVLDRRVILQPGEPINPAQADIWDVDLFNTPKQTIDVLHANGKRVLCYLSVGGSESWRPDFNEIPKSALGDTMPKWPGEHYIDIRSPAVWRFMQKRVRMAYEKGCDGIDPDNVDPFNDDLDRGGGFTPKLVEQDTVSFMEKLSAETRKYGMSLGLKNAEQTLPKVAHLIDFAVNEECSTYEQGCKQYIPFLATGKPVFHFEYVKVIGGTARNPQIQSTYKEWAKLNTAQIRDYYCLRNNFGNKDFISADWGRLFTTVIKKLDLAGWVMYCDGSVGDTPTVQDYTSPRDQQEDEAAGRRGGSRSSSSDSGSGNWLSNLFGGGSSGGGVDGDSGDK